MAEKKEKSKDAQFESLSFEQAMIELQTIVQKVETGQIGLEESIRQYEIGCKLVQHCRKILDGAERKIEILTKSLDGKLETEPYHSEEDS
jgi:exodeoxyribonuclease VII small subunit